MNKNLEEVARLISEARTRFIRESQLASNEAFQLAVLLSRGLGDISIDEAKEALVSKYRNELYKERE